MVKKLSSLRLIANVAEGAGVSLRFQHESDADSGVIKRRDGVYGRC